MFSSNQKDSCGVRSALRHEMHKASLMNTTDIIWITPPQIESCAIQSMLPSLPVRRRIVLVDLFWTRDKDPRVPLGHASLLAALEQEPTLEVFSVVVAVNAGQSDQSITDTILQAAGQVPYENVDVAFGAYIWNERNLQLILPLLRARGFRGRIILGGPQISYAESGLEQLYPDADIFIRGQGETALCEVARSIHRTSVPGVHYVGETDINQQARTVIESLPSPWLNDLIPLKEQAFLRWETQRGCRFKCSFCQHRQPDAQTPRLVFPQSRILQEIDYICRMKVNEVAVLDPVFTDKNNPDHSISVLKRFSENGYAGRLSLQCRAEFVGDAFLDAAQKLDVCLEFGLQSIHEKEYDAIGRRNNLKVVDSVLAKVRQRNIRHEVSLIFGLPEQTLESFKESVSWCLERQVPTIKAFPLLLLRGTKLELERSRWNLVVEDAPMPRVIESSTFCRHEWETMERISEALQQTEGCHPTISDLLKLAHAAQPDQSRWQPSLAKEAV
jgi:hypothetical protein